MTIEAIIFDNDGVLVDSEAIHVRIELELLSELGLRYDYAEYLSRFVGLDDHTFYRVLAADYAEAGLGTFPDDFPDQLHARGWERLLEALQPVPGVDSLLAATAGIPRAVASSATIRKLHAKLKRCNLFDRLSPHIYSAEIVGRGKPAPDLFLHTAAALNVAPAGCVVIEDSRNGILAARAAGMRAIGFTGGGHADDGLADRLQDAGAHRIFADHTTLTAALEEGSL